MTDSAVNNSVVRVKRTTILHRPVDLREMLARSIPRIQEMQRELQYAFNTLAEQFTRLHRIESHAATSRTHRNRARRMSATTLRHQADIANQRTALEGLMHGTQQTLNALQEIDALSVIRMDNDPHIVRFLESMRGMEVDQAMYLGLSPVQNNQRFIDEVYKASPSLVPVAEEIEEEAEVEAATATAAAAAAGVEKGTKTSAAPATTPRLGTPGESSAAAVNFGVWAVAHGAPDVMNSYSGGYYASWEAQARFFQYGNPVHGDLHLRRYTFPTGGFVEIQAHQPVLSTSSSSDALVAAAFFTGGGAGAAAGISAGPISSAVMALAGAITATITAHYTRPSDVAWQGYTARYFTSSKDDSPWGVRHFYGWIASPHSRMAIELNGTHDPNRFHNFADMPEHFSWWNWKSGRAEWRGHGALSLATMSVDNRVDALVDAMAGFAPQGAHRASAKPPKEEIWDTSLAMMPTH